MVRKTYKVYFSASDGNNYYITSGGSDYTRKKYDNPGASATFSSPEDAQVAIRQFLSMRKLKGLTAYPVDNNDEPLSGKFIIKGEVVEQEQELEPEVEIQDRKKKASKAKPKRKVCKCKK